MFQIKKQDSYVTLDHYFFCLLIGTDKSWFRN